MGACALTALGGEKADQATARLLKVHPSAQPQPAFEYRLLPPSYERQPGNAATLYNAAALLLAEQEDEALLGKFSKLQPVSSLEKASHWSATPLQELPREEVARTLARFSTVLRQVELGAWRERCNWDYPLDEGVSMVLPDLAAYRSTIRLVALRARLEVLEGNCRAAIRTLETGFSFAEHVADGHILINDLVAIAMTSLLLDATEDLIQAPDAPNLYWALTALPCPLVDMREAVELELSGMALWPKQLRKPEETFLNPRQWAVVFNNLAGMTRGGGPREVELGATAIALAAYTDAKRHLIQKGESPEMVEAMPALQVVAIYLRDGWRRRADEALKRWHTPYPQARAQVENLETIVAEARNEKDGILVAALMPALQKVRFEQMKLDRRIAALRVIEAIRLHAAATGGRLPQRLDEIEQVPVPLDPITGEPFAYELHEDRAVLSAPPDPAGGARSALRYEIQIAR
jgi:phage tail protein X